VVTSAKEADLLGVSVSMAAGATAFTRLTWRRVTFKRTAHPVSRPSGRTTLLPVRPALVAANRLVGDLGLVAAPNQETPGPVALAVVRRRA
jgi:hypothetical protein